MAHDCGVPQYIKLTGSQTGKFIGVHLNGVRHLIVEETYNDWAYGSLIINPINQKGQEDVAVS